MTHFADRLISAVDQKKSAVLVGLDPRIDRLPPIFAPRDNSLEAIATCYRDFCFGVIDATAELVPAVKPQAAFFEQLGPAGMQALAEVIMHARSRQLLVVLDGKRGDIGSTAKAYAAGYLGESTPWKADALTVNPYLGDDSLTPFVEQCKGRGAGIFVLVKTSNPGGRLFQDLAVADQKVFEHVANHVEQLATDTRSEQAYGIVGAVVGATYPEELQALRQRMPHAWFLIPGFGSQGGTAEDVAAGFDAQGRGAIVNSSRAIIFAHERREYEHLAWQDAVAQATTDMNDQLRQAIRSA